MHQIVLRNIDVVFTNSKSHNQIHKTFIMKSANYIISFVFLSFSFMTDFLSLHLILLSGQASILNLKKKMKRENLIPKMKNVKYKGTM